MVSCVLVGGLVGLVVSVVHTVLASDGAFGDGRGREGQDNKGDEGQARCELHGEKFGKRLFNYWFGMLLFNKLDCFRNCEKKGEGGY